MTERRVRDLTVPEFAGRLTGEGLGIRIGPFNAHLQVDIPDLAVPLYSFYSAFPLLDNDEVFSFRVRVESRRPLSRIYKRNVRFYVDGQIPHEDLPFEQALPVLEWGINLVIALRSHAFLMLHTAVVEKDGNALLLPAAPGFGKSTLCAALSHRGWRLLSDEFGLVRIGKRAFEPIPRPIALKNESIDVIGSFAPDAFIGPVIKNTRKGDVAHVAPPTDSAERQDEAASLRWIVFPRWIADEKLSLDDLPKSDGFMKLAMNAFNYELLGEAGFNTVKALIDGADCYRLEYSNLDQAVAAMDCLAESHESA